MPEKEHIYVGIPCGFWVTASIAVFNGVLQKLSVDPECRYRFTVGFKINCRPADYARNCIVKDFLATDATKLWFVDSDLLLPDNAIRVILPDVDIVGGLYPAFGMQDPDTPCEAHYTVYEKHSSGGYVPAPRYEKGLHRCSAIGTGMMAIKREVLENPNMHYERAFKSFNAQRCILSDDDPPPVFQNRHKPNGQFDATEDIDFCLRASNEGYTIAADHEVICGHVKENDVEKIVRYGIDAFTKGVIAAKAEIASQERRVIH